MCRSRVTRYGRIRLDGAVGTWSGVADAYRESFATLCGESFHAMLGRDSIIGWHVRSFSRKRAPMRTWAAAAEGPAFLLFTRSTDLAMWIDTLGDRAANGRRLFRAA